MSDREIMEYDVIIVGAGPAGTAAAITLARAGLDVTLLDKAVFPRDKICGDGLTSLALGLLEDLAVALEHHAIHRHALAGPDAHPIQGDAPERAAQGSVQRPGQGTGTGHRTSPARRPPASPSPPRLQPVQRLPGRPRPCLSGSFG
mgnify:CR=1 FL=1